MALFEAVYENTEQAQVRFIGVHTEEGLYDLGLLFSNQFFGKTMIINLQTGRTALADASDLANPIWLKEALQLKSEAEAERLAHFLEDHIPSLPWKPEY
ncbi:DUF3055 domain-containing protein [Hydrogenibacillus schlegelii]|uniref:DUF3055 domain-containing protein n=1 Tax=Hydrogenibacillus schlegelii TaxID=1484 RepID=A0A179IQ48_HYDSH|nr:MULTISPECIES: DUF3055 domain-containing protein [Hydrogenibacillus]MBE3563704.1 DUF3055 domain-containing protein [Hydrogenibacillus schlegelii]MBT9282772.1 DUF3055 domain-containing protein [Hydrogenibacillus schlegelii]OAR03741.1 hypothetical protein SA87_00735 [Hydrogenibacillus schlegelii]PTQ52376.1 MAG: hypothetical protein HSCHL_0427 [Hydrogenibacillus schlegelii]QZA33799.1 DUF3055 domain-containing protein [Hydrogenibacillus sp. N12]